MTDTLTPEQRHRAMSHDQGGWRRNRLERAVHEWMVSYRVNHRMNPRRTPGHPDAMIYLEDGRRLGLFVDGCFWHACPIHYRPPSHPRPSWNHDLVAEERDRWEKRKRLSYPWVRVWGHNVGDGTFADIILGAIREA